MLAFTPRLCSLVLLFALLLYVPRTSQFRWGRVLRPWPITGPKEALEGGSRGPGQPLGLWGATWPLVGDTGPPGLVVELAGGLASVPSHHIA